MKKAKILTAAVAGVLAAAALTMSASAYNAYIGFQTAAYSFRNKPSDASYGIESAYFADKFIVWGAEDDFEDLMDNYDYDIEAYALPANYTDCTIDADGTYEVAVDGIDWSLDNSTNLNLLFVATDIPCDTATISNVEVYVDGALAYSMPEAYIDPDEVKNGTTCFLIRNIWNTELENAEIAYPTESMSIKFTVAGLPAADAAVEAPAEEVVEAPAEEAAVDTTTATADDKNTNETPEVPNTETGVEGIAAVAGLAVIATAAIVITRRKK